jgi:hypothetical protein
MSLRDMRCDRCGELEGALYRAGPFGLPEVPWFCEDCMRETSRVLDEETKRIVRILKEYNETDDGDF